MKSIAIVSLIFVALWAAPGYACHQDGLVGERCGRTVSLPGDNTIYFTYQTFLSDSSRIIFERSDDLGSTWSSPVIISSAPGGIRPAIAADRFGGVYVAWAIEDAGQIYWTYSLDAGKTWAEESFVAQQGIHNPEIAVERSSRDNITVKIASIKDDNKHLAFFSTTDLGESWSDTTDVDELEVGRAALIQGRANPASHLAYVTATLRQITYANESDSFQSHTVVDENPNQVPVTFMTMVSPRPQILYVTWTTAGDEPALRQAMSRDGGGTWEQLPDPLNTGDRYARPHLVARQAEMESQIFLASLRSPDLGVVFLRSLDSGVTWTDPLDLCPPGFICAWPRVSFGTGEELMVTMGARALSGNGEILPQHMFLTTSIDNGVTWSEPRRLTGSCDGFPATIVGTEEGDVLYGTSGSDVITALGGDDRIFGLGGDDGDDTCNGGIGNDTVANCEITRNIP